ncbi:MAG: hypothetical protein WBA74_26675, partial [Cyclobacteriaceae bacterium]
QYCKVHGLDFVKARNYVLSKRYDPFQHNQSKMVGFPPFSYSIDTWEEPYTLGENVLKIRFHQLRFREPDGRSEVGGMRYFSVPTEVLDFALDFELPILEEFVEKALLVEPKFDLLWLFGLTVMKRKRQKRAVFIERLKITNKRLIDFSNALGKEFRNSQRIWFCQQAELSEAQRTAIGFRNIQGTGFCVASVPSSGRRGKVEVRIS